MITMRYRRTKRTIGYIDGVWHFVRREAGQWVIEEKVR